MAEPEGYVYDKGFEKERERLVGMATLWDPGTARALEATGVGEGWRCLEVGAGVGSVAEWLADRVGENGKVVATDLNTSYAEPLARDNLEVVEHDITSGDAPDGGGFDLVHARLLLEHIPGTDALANMVAAAKPGGWVVAEDYDMISAINVPESEVGDKVQAAVLGFMSEVGGFDPYYGRNLIHALRGAGLEDVNAEGRLVPIHGGTPGTDFYRFSLESLREVLVERGDLTNDDVDTAIAQFDDPDRLLLGPIMISARGRKR